MGRVWRNSLIKLRYGNIPIATVLQKPPSKYASHPYPVLTDEDAYSASVKPLNIVLKSSVESMTVSEDSYNSTVKPLSFALRTVVVGYYGSDDDKYVATVKPLAFKLETI